MCAVHHLKQLCDHFHSIWLAVGQMISNNIIVSALLFSVSQIHVSVYIGDITLILVCAGQHSLIKMLENQGFVWSTRYKEFYTPDAHCSLLIPWQAQLRFGPTYLGKYTRYCIPLFISTLQFARIKTPVATTGSSVSGEQVYFCDTELVYKELYLANFVMCI